MNYTSVFNYILMGCLLLLALYILIAIVRSFLGPKMSDRIIAVNMIGTFTISIIAILTIYLGEDYLADVCLIYAMISFLSVVLLSKIWMGVYNEKKDKKTMGGEEE